MRTIYFDMDGTIADLYGVKNWLECLQSENTMPYEKAEPLCDMVALNKTLATLQAKGWKIGIISWLSKNSSKNYAKAVHLWKLAAQQGNADALLNLGIAYQEGGKGVNKNDAYAYVLFNEAASKNETASEKLQALESSMSVEEINKAQELSIEEVIGKK